MKAYRNFKIIEYLNPGWYFNLIPVDSLSYSICCFNSDVMKFPDEFERIIFPDSRFETKTAIDLDAGFQAWNRGIMLTAKNIPLDKIQHKENISVKDEYIFIRKYYKWHRVYYYLIKNLLSFNNPFKEIGAFARFSKNTFLELSQDKEFLAHALN